MRQLLAIDCIDKLSSFAHATDGEIISYAEFKHDSLSAELLNNLNRFLLEYKIDIYVFDKLRNKLWFIPPLASSINGSVIDTFLFFSIAFYGTGIPWFTLAIGDLAVKLLVALLMLIPFRILLRTFKPI